MIDETGPRRMGEDLDRVLRSLGGPNADTLTTLVDRWEDLVGPAAAEAVRPVTLERGVLVVAVTEPAWASQIRWLEADIVRRAADLLGPGTVQRVEARVRP